MIPSYLVLSQQIKNELNNIQRVIDRILKVWPQIQEKGYPVLTKPFTLVIMLQKILNAMGSSCTNNGL